MTWLLAITTLFASMILNNIRVYKSEYIVYMNQAFGGFVFVVLFCFLRKPVEASLQNLRICRKWVNNYILKTENNEERGHKGQKGRTERKDRKNGQKERRTR